MPLHQPPKRRAAVLLLAVLAAIPAPPAGAHGDHGAAPPGVVVIAPRAEARAGTVEIVAEFAAGGTLAVFLSGFADGAPLTGARVEVSTDLQSATLAESDPGVYVTRDILLAEGHNDLTVAVTPAGEARAGEARAGETRAAALTQTLGIVIPAPHPAAPPAAAAALAIPPHLLRLAGSIGGLALAGLAAGLLRLRLRRPAARAA